MTEQTTQQTTTQQTPTEQTNIKSSFQTAFQSYPSGLSRQLTYFVYEKLNDTITWNSRFQPYFQEWRVVAPTENSGFVVEFHDVDMTWCDCLEIYSKGNDSFTLRRNFTKVKKGDMVVHYEYISRAPLLMYEREMVIRILSACQPLAWHVYSFFSLSYTALSDSLPPLAHPPKKDPTESDVMYNCAGIRHLPEAFTCDGIRHCVGGEDETNCSYTQQGCGEDWTPTKTTA
ncbi:hypothetical protein ACOMHN_000374 [Nucella lapillus]